MDKNCRQLSIRSTKSRSLRAISIENYPTIAGTLERYGSYIKCNWNILIQTIHTTCYFKHLLNLLKVASFELTLICINWFPGDPRTIFLVTSFTRKMPESSDSMYSSIFMLENIWYHHFTWSGPNSQEIVNFIPNMGPGGTKLNWSKIHSYCKVSLFTRFY